MVRNQSYSLQTLESNKPLPAETSAAVCPSTEDQSMTEIKSRKTLMRFFILLIAMVSLIYSIVLAQLVTVQYVYAYFHKTYYPNVSFSTNESECQLNRSSQLYHDQQTVQKITSQFNIYTELAKGIPGIFGIFFYGTLSDKYGRKIFLLVPVIGNLLKCVLLTVGIYLNWNVYTFILFYFIDGCGGSWGLVLSIVMSIVADLTEPGKTRTFVIAMAELSLGLGVVIGSFTSGFIIHAEGFLSALLISSCCSALPLLLLVFVPETLKKTKNKQSKSGARLAVDIFVFYFKDAVLDGKRKIFLVCMFIYFFTVLAVFGGNGIETLYGLNSPFCMSSVQVGVFITMRSGIPLVIGMLLFRPLQLCIDESLIAVIANLSQFAGFILEAFAYNTIMLYFVPVLSFARTLIFPVVRGTMSGLTPQEKQGTMFAGIAIAETFCTQFGSVASNAIYGHTVETFRGSAFLVLAGYTTAAGILSVVLYRLTRQLKT